jgi:hypothetical protein
MQYFKKCSDYITGQLYPTLAFTIPAYNYLLDKIEDIIDNEDIRDEIKNAATVAKNKIEEYYPTTGGHIYIIATGWLDIFYNFYKFTFIFILIIYLILPNSDGPSIKITIL